MKAYISRPSLLAAIEAVRVAASTDSTRYGLTGIRARFSDTTLELAATDGHRAHRATVPATSGEAGEILYSVSSLEKLAKALKAAKPKRGMDEPTVEVTASTAKIGEDVIGLAVESGEFPALDHVIPRKTSNDEPSRGDIFGIAPCYLADAMNAAAKMHDGTRYARIQPGETRLSPLRVDLRGSHGLFMAVVMPMRMD